MIRLLRKLFWPLVKAGVEAKIKESGSPFTYLVLIKLELADSGNIFIEQGYNALVDYICSPKNK